jgi:hypothetical protein
MLDCQVLDGLVAEKTEALSDVTTAPLEHFGSLPEAGSLHRLAA